MRLAGALGQLTYCTNIHRGEEWPEVRGALEDRVLSVKRRVSPSAPFGIGLRLSRRAADALAEPAELERFRAWLAEHDLYVLTLNGFPYGAFHGERVKERVYRPDWTERERLDYTATLARVFAELLPEGGRGSISTVPGGQKARVGRAEASVAEALIDSAAHLHQVREQTGKTLTLALEPEPCCMLETIEETVAFFEAHLFSRAARERLTARTGAADPEAILRRHLGVCLDACHAAVEFEEPSAAVGALRHAGITIAKVQLSSGLRVRHVDAEALDVLARWSEDVYLHQVVARRGEALTRHLDLPEAIADARRRSTPDDEWRVHFHVPIFHDRLGRFDGTRAFLDELLALHARDPFTEELEVETYTFGVLPEALRDEPVEAAIARELRFARERLEGCGSPSP